MKIRELTPADAPKLLEFMQRYFPEEEALAGTRPEGVQRLLDRMYRWDTRFLLALFRLAGRPVYDFYVADDGGRLIGTTMLSYPGPSAYVSFVSVDAEYRRRGVATTLLKRADDAAKKARKTYLVLDVLAHNTPAITLYERLGYQRLRTSAFFVLDPPATGTGPAPANPAIRPYRSSDATALVAIVRARNPPEVERVMPTRKEEITGSRIVARAMEEENGAWVVDRGHGAEAWVRATVSPLTDASMITNPIIGPSVEPALSSALVRTAVGWCHARRAGRIMVGLTGENERGRAALDAGGFHEALGAFTLYRTVA